MRNILLIAALFLVGCASQILNKSLPHLIGRDVQYAISVLGAPTSTSSYGETEFVSWSINQTGTMILPTFTTSHSTRYIGAATSYGTTTTSGMAVIPTNAFCTVTLHVQKGIVKRVEYRGNQAGCMQFASRVQSLSE